MNSKNLYLIFLLSFLLSFLLIGFCFARELEISYPPIPGAETPTTTKTLLPDYVRYIFNLSITIAGIVAFGALVYGGFLYLTSSGNPSKMDNAKDQIFSAFLGLIILLSSYLILTTINPQLVEISPGLESLGMGLQLCNATKDKCETYSISRSNIEDLEAANYEFLSNFDDLDVYVYSEKNWEGEKRKLEASSGDLPILHPKSIQLEWKTPGVYLCKEGGEECTVYENSSDNLGEFNNKVKIIKFRNPELKTKEGKEILYGAILHDRENRKGGCDVFFSSSTGAENKTPPDDLLDNNASSITVFRFHWGEGGVTRSRVDGKEGEGDGVTLYENKDYKEGGTCGFLPPHPCGKWGPYKELWASNFNKLGRSIKIEGNYLVILFENTGYNGVAEVFTQSDPSLAENDIGICGNTSNLGCFGSVVIFPIIK